MAVNIEWLDQRIDNAGGKLARVVRAGFVLDDRKFVAAEPGHCIRAQYDLLQPFGDRAKQRVADRMSQRIVDALEAVEIEEHDRQLVAAGQCFFHLVLEQDAIGQIGQRVMARHVHDLGFGLPALGDVLIGRHPAAVGSRAVQTRHHPAVAEFVASADPWRSHVWRCSRSAIISSTVLCG